MIDVGDHIACQFWIMIFCSASRACSRTDLSSLNLAFSIIISLICRLSITLNYMHNVRLASRVEAAELTEVIACNRSIECLLAAQQIFQLSA